MADLRAILKLDAVVCGAFGSVFAVFASPLVPLLLRDAQGIIGLDPVVAFRALGLAVLAIGLGVAIVGRMQCIHLFAVVPILAIEVVWLAACSWIVLSAHPTLTSLGLVVVVVSALTVAAFLALELLGLRAARTPVR